MHALQPDVRAFEHFGGVVARCIYDNLKAAVKLHCTELGAVERTGGTDERAVGARLWRPEDRVSSAQYERFSELAWQALSDCGSCRAQQVTRGYPVVRSDSSSR